MGMVLGWAFVFMLGFTVGALVSWWFTLYWECPKRYTRKDATEEQAFDIALRVPEGRDMEVFYQGRWYQQSRQLLPHVFQQVQRLSLHLLRWLDEAERPRYVQESAPSKHPTSAAGSPKDKTGLERMHEEIDRLVQRKARAMGIETPIRIMAMGTTVVIWVGREKYERLTDIPDPRIQFLIQDAVREWEDEWQRRWRQRQEKGGLPPAP